ncbi:MAG: hypothetical protein JSS27_12625 [Planctomycetes bacterium]|nr:hypothetical protein [Planctomycetota bacterium]
MSTTSDTKADLEEVVRAMVEKRPVDPEVAKRIHERAARVQVKFDYEASVELIRAIRDE